MGWKLPRVRGGVVLVLCFLGLPILLVAIVALMTWEPLYQAGKKLDRLEETLGEAAVYTPLPNGEIPARRMEAFLEVRKQLASACDDYGTVRRGFETVEALDEENASDPRDVVDAVRALGGASVAITPFLARYFERRNEALLAVGMSLQEYVYIYAVAYHDQLLAEETRAEIFSDGVPLSPEASRLLVGCLDRQWDEADTAQRIDSLEREIERMRADPTRLPWQDGLPVALQAGVGAYRSQLDALFCPATAGLEMEKGAKRALRVALE